MTLLWKSKGRGAGKATGDGIRLIEMKEDKSFAETEEEQLEKILKIVGKEGDLNGPSDPDGDGGASK